VTADRRLAQAPGPRCQMEYLGLRQDPYQVRVRGGPLAMSGKRQLGPSESSRLEGGRRGTETVRPDVLRAVNFSDQDRCDAFPRVGGGHSTRSVHRSPRGTSDLRRWSDRRLRDPVSETHRRQEIGKRSRRSSPARFGAPDRAHPRACPRSGGPALEGRGTRDRRPRLLGTPAAVNADLMLDHPLGTSRCLESCTRSDQAIPSELCGARKKCQSTTRRSC